MNVLKAAHQDLVVERDRMRVARASFTGRLGPFPASAGVAIGLTGSVVENLRVVWLAEAAALLGLVVFVSTFYSGVRPYRLLRAERQRAIEEARGIGGSESDLKQLGFGLAAKDERSWLGAKIDLEQSLCGGLRRQQRFLLSRSITDLQQGIDVERSALNVVQFLFVDIIVVLVLGIALRNESLPTQSIVAGGVLALTALGLAIAYYLGDPGARPQRVAHALRRTLSRRA